VLPLFLALTQDDEAQILALYDQESELTNKLTTTWALAVIGGEDSATALMGTLGADYKDIKMKVRPKAVLSDSIRVLGFIAARSDRAFEFLQAATFPTYWRQNRTWMGLSESSEDYTARKLDFEDRRLASIAIGSWLAADRGAADVPD
jgi:hypothetical protein